jgi:hypothetical protein
MRRLETSSKDDRRYFIASSAMKDHDQFQRAEIRLSIAALVCPDKDGDVPRGTSSKIQKYCGNYVLAIKSTKYTGESLLPFYSFSFMALRCFVISDGEAGSRFT